MVSGIQRYTGIQPPLWPFGVANAPAVFQELVSKILALVRARPKVQELISHGAELEAHIHDVLLGNETKADHYVLVGEFLAVCKGYHLRVKWEKCEWVAEETDYLGFEIGWGWWRPSAKKVQPLQSANIADHKTQGVHDVRSFIGAVHFYRRHVK